MPHDIATAMQHVRLCSMTHLTPILDESVSQALAEVGGSILEAAEGQDGAGAGQAAICRLTHKAIGMEQGLQDEPEHFRTQVLCKCLAAGSHDQLNHLHSNQLRVWQVTETRLGGAASSSHPGKRACACSCGRRRALP